jgi:hypothetical protein
MFIPEDRKHFGFYPRSHLKRTMHKMKETYIEPNSFYINGGYAVQLADNRKIKAKLSTQFLKTYRLDDRWQSKKDFKEDDEYNFKIDVNNYANVVPGDRNIPLYLAFQYVNDKSWSSYTNPTDLNTFTVTLRWNVIIYARYWVEFNNLREWQQDVSVTVPQTLGQMFPPPQNPTNVTSEVPFYPPRAPTGQSDALLTMLPWANREIDDTKRYKDFINIQI